MANKNIFTSTNTRFPSADTTNEAGGRAYQFDSKHALAQLAATGCISDTFYTKAEDQLDQVLKLAQEVPTEYLAKVAVFSRQRGFMKDMPALLCAVLAVRDADLLKTVFPKIMDNGKMIRNFAQIMRSGRVGRKCFGSVPKRLIQKWFEQRPNDRLFNDSVGNDPSMADVIRMTHPKPKDKEQEALFKYMLGREHNARSLPDVVKAFERFKKDLDKTVPDVSFQMLTALPLTTEHWTEIAKNMNWHSLRMNLNTLARHGVFKNKDGSENREMVDLVASKLADAEQVRKVRVFPYQLMAAYKFSEDTVPHRILVALQKAMDVAVENIPVLEDKKVWIFTDVSGSMSAAVTGSNDGGSKGRKWGATTQISCKDMAAVVTAAFLRRNPDAEAMLFSDEVHPTRLNNGDSIMTTAEKISKEPSGGTNCSAPMAELARRKERADLIIYVSDNMSWADSDQSISGGQVGGLAPRTMVEFAKVRARNPGCKLVMIDGCPNTSSQVKERKDILNCGGFSDVVFEIIAEFANGRLDRNHWIGEIERTEL